MGNMTSFPTARTVSPVVKEKMPTSTVGKSNSSRIAGFTLIELVVVTSLISIMLFVSVPRLRDTFVANPRRQTIQWLAVKAQAAREAAATSASRHVLHIDLDAQRLWVSNDQMAEDELEAVSEQGFPVPDNIAVTDVQFPYLDKISFGTAAIHFYPAGYSDKALIHLESEDGSATTLLIEPFLNAVKLYEAYAGFEETGFYAS